MHNEKNLNDFYRIKGTNKTPMIDSSTNISPYSLDASKAKTKKLNEMHKITNLTKSENISNSSPVNEQHELKEKEQMNLKNKLIDLKKKLISINNSIKLNFKEIEKLKNSLNKLKQEKNKKKSDIVNLLSNKESLDEIYNNYIDYLKNKNKGNKLKDKKFNNIKSNPLDNQDEDAFEILISEIKEIDLNKFIEQTFNLIEEIFENPNQQLKLQLKEIINKSYSLFNNAISSSPFLDTYSIVSNFFLRISLFLSNQSNGKYSETIINLFLRCLLKMNSINEKNEKLINYMNTNYKEEKGKIRQEIGVYISKNEILNKSKIVLENQIKEIEIKLKIKKTDKIELNQLNKNISNYKYYTNDKNIENKKYAYFQTEIKKEKNIDSKYKSDSMYKKIEIKEKLKNKFRKVYKEDMIDIKDNNEDILNDNVIDINYADNLKDLNNSINNNDIKKINNVKKSNRSDKKLYDNFMEKINKINISDKHSINSNDIKRENEENIEHFATNESYNNKYTSKYKKEKELMNKGDITQNLENNIKKYNTINNYHGISKKNIAKKEYISPQINSNKIQTYYKSNIINESNIKKYNYNHNKILERIYYNKKFKATNKQPKKKLNYHYYTKETNNNIISYNDINKNMKYDLEKKIKYLDRVYKNNSNSKLQSINLSKNNKDKCLYEANTKCKRLLTEKKEKKFKYNFFDIIQETNKKRNNSGENKLKYLNNLNSSSNYINLNSKYGKDKIFSGNDESDKYKTNYKHNYDLIIKSDFIKERTKSYYDKGNFHITNSNSKYIKNGIESGNNYNNGSDSPYTLLDLSFPNKNKTGIEQNKIKNKNIINKSKKQEINSINKMNALNNRNQYYHCNKNTYNYNNSAKKDNFASDSKFQSFKKEKNLNKILNKEIKKNNIYFIISESKNISKNNNRLFGKYNKNDNINEQNSKSKSKSNRSELSKNNYLDRGYNSCSKPKNKISNFNFNYKFNKTLLLKRSLSSTLNKLLNNNLRKKCIIELYNDNNNNSSSNNSFNVSNSLGVSYINNNNNKKMEHSNKMKINKDSIANLKIGIKNSVEIKKDQNKKMKKLNNILKISNNNIIIDDYNTLLNKFKQNQKDTFCYFKIFEKDFKTNAKFNPLENCSINPENFGYNEGYISIDINESNLKITPKNINLPNTSSYKRIHLENELLSKINEINRNFNTNSKNIKKDYCLNIDIKNLIDIDQTFVMNNIIKIHSIFIKYNSNQKNNNINDNNVNNNSKNDKKVLNINKLIYVREIKEINMPQNEKIKAILCNYFSFSFLFEKFNNKIEIELIFINFEQYNLWNKFINSIIDLNKEKNKEEFFERKKNIVNNSKEFTHTKSNIENGSNINEGIASKISNNEIILNI